MINTIFTILIAFLGFPLGILLAKISSEEIKKGKKYFFLMQNILLVFILFFILKYQALEIFISIPITIIIFLLMFYWKKDRILPIYSLFGIILFLSHPEKGLFAIQSFLIFIFGLASGSYSSRIRRNKFASTRKEVILQVLKTFTIAPLSIVLIYFF